MPKSSRNSYQEKELSIKIIHIMADGSTRESVEGVVVQNEAFYEVLNGILEKKEKREKRR